MQVKVKRRGDDTKYVAKVFHPQKINIVMLNILEINTMLQLIISSGDYDIALLLVTWYAGFGQRCWLWYSFTFSRKWGILERGRTTPIGKLATSSGLKYSYLVSLETNMNKRTSWGLGLDVSVGCKNLFSGIQKRILAKKTAYIYFLYWDSFIWNSNCGA